MSASKLSVGWIYFASKEAAPILKKFFGSGKVSPGVVFVLNTEEFKILREGVIYLPIRLDESESRILVPEAG